MDFYAVLDQIHALLRQRGRVSYRALKRQFDLDDAYLDDLKVEIIEVQQCAVDQDGTMLVWTGATRATPLPPPTHPAPGPPSPAHVDDATRDAVAPPTAVRPTDAERRQLTVLFCDLVDSTALSSQLDPEDLRAVVRAYQEVCAKVIARFEGHIAQYLGDGLLVYFGYPLAHEDDAQRAVRAGLGILEAIGQLNTRLKEERGVQLAVRLGVHTGLVVVGEVGGGTRQEQLALGETPNVAARLQGIALSNTLVISAATFQLIGGFFACQPLGTHLLKGVAQPLAVYRVLYESTARSRLEAAGSTSLTPLVGRESEVALLRERWAQVKDGLGQVVLLSGEAGIGKSRLVQVLTEQVAAEPQAWLTPCQCSPYYQHTALYPMIDLLERVALRFEREEASEQKLRKLEGFLVQYGLPLAETVPLFAALLSLPLSADYAPLSASPEQQKQKTLQALLTILLRIAAQQPVLFVMEDLHWVDPSTLELLSLLVDQGPTARILALFTLRPDFSPPWTGRSHLTQVTLNRLPRRQAAELSGRVAHGKALPPEVVEQVVAKTDGVPLFVEELTKMVLESGLLQGRDERYALTGPLPPLAIPATLHDSLMARLDRLSTVKGLAQLGATLGREFTYDLLQAVSPWDEGTLRQGLHQLVAAEFLYQQGLPPQATYRFKHALIQDAAYQSLLRSTRQQYHQRIAQVLETRFPTLVGTQPELVAQHYTAAGCTVQAVGYWLRAGQRAHARAAPAEAVVHFTQGLTLLPTLPDGPERVQQELTLQLAFGPALMVTRGFAAPEVGAAYTRARLLCQQVEETPELFRVLRGLFGFYEVQAQLQTAHELAEQLFHLAQRLQEPALLVEAHRALGDDLFYLGEFAQARQHLEQGLARYEAEQHHDHALLYGQDPGLGCLNYLAVVLWLLGYPEQAQERSRQALALAHQRADPFSLSITWYQAARFHYYRREPQAVREHIEASLALAREQGFALFEAMGTNLHGWSLTEASQAEARLAQMHQGLAALKRTGSGLLVTHLARLAEAYSQGGQPGEGLTLVDEALAIGQRTGEQHHEAELQRLKGEILLQPGPRGCQAGDDPSPEAEACYQQALAIARQQQARSWELRAATSLARLWQQQGRRAEARALLAPIYGWFTEGFGTVDLQEAKGLLDALT